MVKEQKGITLVVLVVTIIVMLIIAGTSVSMIFSDEGMLRSSVKSKEMQENYANEEDTKTDNLINKLDEVINSANSLPSIADNIGTVISETKNTELTDSYDNKIVVPAGFKIVTPSADSTVSYTYSGDGVPSVQDGIVVQDSVGNQFVWIPIGDIKNKDGTTTTITLGRYTFDSSGTETLQQAAYTSENPTNYSTAITIESYYQELETSSYGNTVAKSLGDFVSYTKASGGYYLARFEAGIEGTTANSDLSTKTATDGTVKPLSQYGVGVWNYITQTDTSTVAQAMYDTNNNYVSDLVNSYAWDTTIVFIQKYSENSNYSNQASLNSSLATTGTSGDKVCNIYDMASNCREWSTETSTKSDSSGVFRGDDGVSDSSGKACSRSSFGTHFLAKIYAFRPILYTNNTAT